MTVRRKNFRYLHVNDIEAVIKVKKNSSGKAMGCCYPRKIIAVLQQQLSDFGRWKRRSVGYGHRWMAETVFSAMKRMFGEYVMARNYQKALFT